MSEKLTLWEHFEELRRRIFHSLIGFVVVFIFLSFFTKKIANYIFFPYYKCLPDPSYQLSYTNISEIFFLYFKMVAVVSLFFSAPWFFYQIWLFISPALRKKEKKFAIPFIVLTSFFLMSGMLFAYFVVLPATFNFFFELNKDYRNVVTASSIWNFELIMILAIGLSFETPLLIFFLSRLNLVSIKSLIKNVRWAILLAFIISAVITPSGDPVTQTLVALPIVLLYFLGILLSFIFPSSTKEE